MQPSQKEIMLFKDQKEHEELCIEKYTKYANEAQDPQLKQLFTSLASVEREHLNSINQMLSGQVPAMSQQQQQQQPQSAQAQSSPTPGTYNNIDAALCRDMLTTEKYISGTYDTAVFEFADSNVRQVLNHIQKEEQQHGESLFKYMQSHGMYQTQ